MKVVERMVAAVERGLGAARRRSSLLDNAWLAGERLSDVVSGRLAAAISYYGFFAAFSLAVVAYSILGRAVNTDGGDGLVSAVNSYLSTALPWVLDTATEAGRGQVTALGLAALVVTGVGWVEALRSSQRAVWLLDQHPGNWIIRWIVDLAVLVGLGVLLALSLATSALIDAALDWLAPDTTFGTMFLRATGPVLAFGVNLILAGAVLMVLPRLRLSPRRLVLPALVVAVGISLLNSVGTWYVDRTENRAAYQPVADAVGLLIYLYLLNQLILIGAALAATSRRGTMRDLGLPNGNGPDESGAKPAETAPDGPATGEPRENAGEPPGRGPAEPR